MGLAILFVTHDLGVVSDLGNGYAPVITVRDADGEILYSGATPFLPQDNNYQSVGAIKVAAADPGLGFHGWFLPTAVITAEDGPQSVFPDALQPALALTAYEGELFPDGRPQSVFRLNTDEMTQLSDAEGTDAARLWIGLPTHCRFWNAPSIRTATRPTRTPPR